ncbi:MAG: SurA N-terminal domain-containing protein [Aquincola sp.]|nr:SurA N-terminal domain-containing protein [Aquincola sp.]
MFEFVRTHNRLLFFVLVLLIFPSFVFFGVQGYSRYNDASTAAVARVDGQKVTRAEWDAAHRRQVEQMRNQAPDIDVKLFDSPQARRETLDQIVRERVLFAATARAHLSVSDERLMRELRSIPQLAALKRPDGSFDVAAYKVMVESQGRSTEAFEAGLRQDLALRQVLGGIEGSATPAAASGRAALDALLQQREVQVLRFDAKDQRAGLSPTDAELAAFHQANEAEFRAPEQATIDYVVLDIDALKAQVTATEEDLRKYYQENAARYTVAEERRASHILVKAPKDAPADERQKAKAKAEALLAELRKNPAAFADLAKKNSDDPGSAERGGDLDFFARGAMVKPFEDAAYAMKPGEISNVVETDFGYHIIRLDAVRGGDRKPFEQVRAEIEAEVKKQLAAERFAKEAEQFTNLVNAQGDSLDPVAAKFGLKKLTATVQRTPQPGASGVLASPKLLEAAFASDAIKNKLNTEAIEIGANQLVSARVVQYQAARVMPLSEVQAQVRERVITKQAAARARQAGEAKLAAARAADDKTGLPAPILVSRGDAQGQPRAVVEAALRADPAKLPSWTGIDLGDTGYAVLRVAAVKPKDPASPEYAALLPRVTQAWAAAETQAYLKALERRYKAQVDDAAAAALPASAPGSN